MWHLDAHVCKESFSTLLDCLKRAVARIPEIKVSLKIISIFIAYLRMPNAFYFLTAEISFGGVYGLQNTCLVLFFTVFKTVFPFNMAILIFKCIIPAKTSVFIRVGFLAIGSEKQSGLPLRLQSDVVLSY